MTWERSRAWHLVRPLGYYLREDFVAPELAADADVLDFSAGLGDLSEYLVASGARSVVATRPEFETPESDRKLRWIGGIAAGQIAAKFSAGSFDLATARMVFQFPTWEGDRADPDTMAAEFAQVLRPGGRLVVAFHQFASFEKVPSVGPPPSVDDLLGRAERAGQAVLVRYLGLPPREGPFGETGFGLKVPMLVTTLQNHGFEIEIADHPEPFTMPLNLEKWSDEELVELGQTAMLAELADLYAYEAWPIVRIVARLRSRAGV